MVEKGEFYTRSITANKRSKKYIIVKKTASTTEELLLQFLGDDNFYLGKLCFIGMPFCFHMHTINFSVGSPPFYSSWQVKCHFIDVSFFLLTLKCRTHASAVFSHKEFFPTRTESVT